MANSTEESSCGKIVTQYLSLITLSGLSALAGLLIESLIVVVYVIDWLKGRSITGADQIITSLGISKILHYTVHVFFLLSAVCVSEISKKVYILNDFIYSSSAFAIIWLFTLLSIFYYVKISNIHTVFFLRLKAVVSRRITCLIIACVLLSLGYKSIYYIAMPMILFRNSSQNEISSYRNNNKIPLLSILLTLPPLLIIFIASLLLTMLLGFHMSRMKSRRSGTISTHSYQRIMKFTVVSFLACAFCIIVIFLKIYVGFLAYFWSLVIMNLFSVLQSALLIYMTKKLRNHFSWNVHCGTDCLFNRKAPGPRARETVEMTPQ